jgi:hypothetical protein
MGLGAIGAGPSLTEGGFGQKKLVDHPTGLGRGIGKVVVFKMQEIVKGVVEIPFGSGGAARRTACGAVRGGSPRR